MMSLSLFSVLLFVTSYKSVTSLDLTLLHTNDVHAHVQQSNKYGSACSEQKALDNKCYGGAARLYTQIQAERNRKPNILLLDAGDQFQGTTWFHFYKGLEASYFMKKLGYDAMTLGNHEFDADIQGLTNFVTDVNNTFPVICCNIDFSAYPVLDSMIERSTEVNIGGEVIGIVGWVIKETELLAPKDKIRGLLFLDEIENVKQEVARLQSRGVNKIIGLSHGGLDLDLQIAETVQGIDVIVGGHNNAFLYNGVPPDIETVDGPYPEKRMSPSSEPVLVVQAFMQSKYLGVLDVTFDEAGVLTNWGGNPVLLNGSIPQDARILAEVETWAAPLEDFTKTILGDTYVHLEGSKSWCRLKECNMGNLITDAILSHYISRPEENVESWSDVSIAMWNSGGIRASIDTGDITMEDVLGVLPFGNQIWLVSMKGKRIRDILEYSVQGYSTVNMKGKFLQLTGLRVVYDMSQPDYQRVHSVQVKCTQCTVPSYIEMEDEEVYNILINQYLLDGGDGFTVIVEDEAFYLGDLASDCLADYISRFSPITRGLEGRITFTTQTPKAAATCTANIHISSTINIIVLIIYSIMAYCW